LGHRVKTIQLLPKLQTGLKWQNSCCKLRDSKVFIAIMSRKEAVYQVKLATNYNTPKAKFINVPNTNATLLTT